MQLTDWRGNTYTEGSRVIYAAMSGRSVELQEATVLEIRTVYRHPDTYSWAKLEEGQEIPRERRWDKETEQWIYDGDPVKTELRVKLQPEGKGSRSFHTRQNSESWYENSNTGEKVDWGYIDKVYYLPARIEAHAKTGFIFHNNYKEIADKMKADGWEHKTAYVKPKPVLLTVINNITVI